MVMRDGDEEVSAEIGFHHQYPSPVIITSTHHFFEKKG
jgi:hypothetical protein